MNFHRVTVVAAAAAAAAAADSNWAVGSNRMTAWRQTTLRTAVWART